MLSAISLISVVLLLSIRFPFLQPLTSVVPFRAGCSQDTARKASCKRLNCVPSVPLKSPEKSELSPSYPYANFPNGERFTTKTDILDTSTSRNERSRNPASVIFHPALFLLSLSESQSDSLWSAKVSLVLSGSSWLLDPDYCTFSFSSLGKQPRINSTATITARSIPSLSTTKLLVFHLHVAPQPTHSGSYTVCSEFFAQLFAENPRISVIFTSPPKSRCARYGQHHTLGATVTK
ncbi:hypothetical protein C8R45DRAFT_931311 [Mycena sanguinolenta]|nr:hypothetical protein C8R45DRAFT_931311 [Mycena sanguinolenta]